MGAELEKVVGILAAIVVQSGFGTHLQQRIQSAEVKLEQLPVLGPILLDLFPGLPRPQPAPTPPPAAEGTAATPAAGSPTTPAAGGDGSPPTTPTA